VENTFSLHIRVQSVRMLLSQVLTLGGRAFRRHGGMKAEFTQVREKIRLEPDMSVRDGLLIRLLLMSFGKPRHVTYTQEMWTK